MDKPAPTPDEPVRVVPSRRTKLLLTGLILFHLTAVVAAPLAVVPSSELFGSLFGYLRPYIEIMDLNHGYRFFGPDPGPSHLVRYEIELPNGSKQRGVFPDRHRHWPRLLYHRHFMLSEKIAGGPQETPWVEAYARSYAEHLFHQRGAKKVTLYQRRHLIPWPDQVRRGMRLDDPSLFEERLLIEYSGDQP